jgi:hypothetical protein
MEREIRTQGELHWCVCLLVPLWLVVDVASVSLVVSQVFLWKLKLAAGSRQQNVRRAAAVKQQNKATNNTMQYFAAAAQKETRKRAIGHAILCSSTRATRHCNIGHDTLAIYSSCGDSNSRIATSA